MPGPRRAAATLALLAGPVALLALVSPGAAVPVDHPRRPTVARVSPAAGPAGTRVVLTGRPPQLVEIVADSPTTAIGVGRVGS